MSTKEQILALLESNRGHSISGEYIAERLQVTRNTVWKAVKELKKDGYKIEAVTNKGYCLCEDNDILSVQGITPYLSQKGNSENIFVYDSLESTNKTAKEMAISGAEHGTVIIADRQTAGRGRYDRQFFSPPGRGVYMSFILRPARLRLETPTLITALAAVAVCEAIEAVSKKVPRIKWVNDIYLDGKKACGILTEAVTDFESGSVQWMVVGIGVNFSAYRNDFPEYLRPIAGPVFPNGSRTTTRNHLAAEIVNRISAYGDPYNRIEIINKYKKRLMMIGKRVFVTEAQEAYEAEAIDIDDTGRLIVQKDNGEIHSLSAGEISIKN